MCVSQQLPDNDPRVLAFDCYKESDEYQRIVSWLKEGNYAGELWAVFLSGWHCASTSKESALSASSNTTKAEIELLLKGAIIRYREMNYAAGESCINEALARLSAVR